MVAVEPRRRGRGGPCAPVDPLDASLAFPRSKGSVQPAPIDLIAHIQSYPPSEQPFAVALALCKVNVGIAHVSVFGTLWRLFRHNLSESETARRDNLLCDIQANPYAFQNAVESACRMTDQFGDKWRYAANLAPDFGVAKLVVRIGEVMDLLRWPATSASQQRSYAFCRVLRESVVCMSAMYGQLLVRPPLFLQDTP